MDELLAFVAARLSEEEADARLARPQSWPNGLPTHGGMPLAVNQRHAARQDPRATLARVAALRSLVAYLVPAYMEDVAGLILRHVAAVWAWHPDYREAWKP